MISPQRLLLAGLIAGLLPACTSTTPEPPPSPGLLPPAPTEHRLRDNAEEENKERRERWKRHMHKAPPEVDWEEIERENGARETWRRRRIGELEESNPAFAAGAGASRWTEVGSSNQAGRMHCAVLGPAREDAPQGRYLYAGSSLGGVWRANPDGTDWTPLSDNLYGGAHEIAVLAADVAGEPDIVIACTDGGNVHYTRDGGATWTEPAGLDLVEVRGIGVLQDAASTVILYGRYATGPGTRGGIFRSTDKGLTFQNTWTSGQDGRGSIWIPREGAAAQDTIYMLHRGRVRVSTDSGSSFTTLDTIDSSSDRGRLTGSEAGAPTLYAAVRVGGSWELHRSDNAGGSFVFMYGISDFWESLCASTNWPNIVVFSGVESWRSTNSGASFTKINNWWDYYSDPVNKLHADTPGLYCWPDPDGGFDDIWYVCTDGGLFESTDDMNTVYNRSQLGLGVSQYYSTHTSVNDRGRILAGAQDQGYQRGQLVASTGPGPSTPFDQIISGDYGHLTSSDGSHDFVYSTYPGFVLIQQGELNPQVSTSTNFPGGSVNAWLPPVVADPDDPESFFFLGNLLWRYTRTSGWNWNHVQHSTFNFTAGGASYLSGMAFAPTDSQRVYAVDENGGLYWSADHGVNWTASASPGPDAHYFYGNTVCVHPTNPLEAAVGGSSYSGAGVRRTTDGGVTWELETFGLPLTMVYGLTYAGDGSGDLYAATEAGAYRWDRTTNVWENVMGNDAPITLYWSVEAVEDDTIRFGTYGRGIWDYDLDWSTDGIWSAYGAGAGGANVLDLDSVTPPNIGGPITLDVRNANGPTMGWVFWSDGQGFLPDWGGTWLLGAMEGVIRNPIAANGEGSVDLRIPDDAGLIGQDLYFQAVVQDPSQAGGWALSNGLRATIGY